MTSPPKENAQRELGANQNKLHAFKISQNPIDVILSCLDKVKPTGSGKWIACCPAHKDKSPSLAMKEADDGRVLLHCFGGCDVLAVLSAIGLDMKDLFPKREGNFKPIRQPFSAADALRCISRESLLIAIVAADLKRGVQVSDEDLERVWKASDRIRAALQSTGVQA